MGKGNKVKREIGKRRTQKQIPPPALGTLSLQRAAREDSLHEYEPIRAASLHLLGINAFYAHAAVLRFLSINR